MYDFQSKYSVSYLNTVKIIELFLYFFLEFFFNDCYIFLLLHCLDGYLVEIKKQPCV